MDKKKNEVNLLKYTVKVDLLLPGEGVCEKQCSFERNAHINHRRVYFSPPARKTLSGSYINMKYNRRLQPMSRRQVILRTDALLVKYSV